MPSLSTLLVDRTGGSFQSPQHDCRVGTINAFPIHHRGNDRMTIDTTGAVGIGTSGRRPAHSRRRTVAWSRPHRNSNSEITLAEESTATTGMVIPHDGNVNRMDVLARLSGVDQTPVLSISRSANPLIGIGTTTPMAALHVQEGSAGTIVPAATASLILERSNHNYIQMYAPDANETGILFGGDTVDVDGGIVFNNASVTDGLSFRAGGNSTKMVITSLGDVGVGTIAPDSKFHVAAGPCDACRWWVHGQVTPQTSTRHRQHQEIMGAQRRISTLFLNNDGDVSIFPNGMGKASVQLLKSPRDLARNFLQRTCRPGASSPSIHSKPRQIVRGQGCGQPLRCWNHRGANDFHTGRILSPHRKRVRVILYASAAARHVRANVNGVIQPRTFCDLRCPRPGNEGD
jgi:hypothetical protein